MIVARRDDAADQFVVGVVDDGLGVVEEDELLAAFLLHRLEVLLMGGTEVGQHGDGRLNDVAQGQHLTWLTDAGFEDTHLRVGVHEPHGEGHTNLRIIATR